MCWMWAVLLRSQLLSLYIYVQISTLHPVISHTLGPSTTFACPAITYHAQDDDICDIYAAIAASSDIPVEECGRTIWTWRQKMSGRLEDTALQKKNVVLVRIYAHSFNISAHLVSQGFSYNTRYLDFTSATKYLPGSWSSRLSPNSLSWTRTLTLRRMFLHYKTHKVSSGRTATRVVRVLFCRLEPVLKKERFSSLLTPQRTQRVFEYFVLMIRMKYPSWASLQYHSSPTWISPYICYFVLYANESS